MSLRNLGAVVKFIALAGAMLLVCGQTADGFPVIYSIPVIHAVADAIGRLFLWGIDYPLIPTGVGIGAMIFCAYKV